MWRKWWHDHREAAVPRQLRTRARDDDEGVACVPEGQARLAAGRTVQDGPRARLGLCERALPWRETVQRRVRDQSAVWHAAIAAGKLGRPAQRARESAQGVRRSNPLGPGAETVPDDSVFYRTEDDGGHPADRDALVPAERRDPSPRPVHDLPSHGRRQGAVDLWSQRRRALDVRVL